MGAHTLGWALPRFSGFDGKWVEGGQHNGGDPSGTSEMHDFDNEFYKLLVDEAIIYENTVRKSKSTI